MSHLGRWLTALVDDELDEVERDRLLNHLAGCEHCRREANELRALKRRMTSLGDAAADAEIADRLIDLATSGRHLVGGLPDWPGPRQLRSPGAAGARPRQGRPGWKILTGSAGTAVLAVGLIAFLLGGAQTRAPAPKITPAFDTYWLQHGYDTGQEPVTGPGGAATGASAPAPAFGGISATSGSPAAATPMISAAPSAHQRRPGTRAATMRLPAVSSPQP